MEYSETPERLLPLPPAVFHILISLCGADRHGYGIMLEIAERTRNQVKLGPGSFYRVLNETIEGGLVEESHHRPRPAADDPRRSRYYRLTPFGRKVAEAETKRLSDMLVVTKRLLANS